MAINPLLLNVKPISEITTVDNPTEGHLLFYDGSDELKKTNVSDFYDAMQSAYLGIATTTTTPPATGAYWYRVDAPGTYMGITVTDGDFKDVEGNYYDVTLEVKDGVVVKRNVKKYKDENQTVKKNNDPSLNPFFNAIKNVWIFDKNFKKTSDYFSDYFWVNDAIFGKFGFQVSNGVDYINFTIPMGTEILPNSIVRLEKRLPTESNDITVIVEFADFGVWDNTRVFSGGTFYTDYAFIYNSNHRVENLLNEYEGKVNKITATRNANNFNSIRELINSITDASETNRYEVFVPNGEWFEVDIHPKKWVKILCESKDTVIFCNATDTNPLLTLPNDYQYVSERGKQLASADRMAIHTLFITEDTDIENGTFITIRGKYAVHIDNGGFQNAKFKNVTFEGRNCIAPVGIGIWGGQKLIFENCKFENGGNDLYYGVAIHNWNNQAKGTITNLTDCFFDSCKLIKVDELGSNQTDVINLINCNSNLENAIYIDAVSADGTNSYWNDTNGQPTTNPLNVPYNFKINAIGTKIDNIQQIWWGWVNNSYKYNRDLSKVLDASNLSDFAKKYTALEVLQKGDLVSFSGLSVKKYTGNEVAEGIVLNNANANDKVWVVGKGKIADVVATGVNWNNNATKKLTYNNGLVSNPTANHYEVLAVAVESWIETGVKAKLI